jgi:hypothetical protein
MTLETQKQFEAKKKPFSLFMLLKTLMCSKTLNAHTHIYIRNM